MIASPSTAPKFTTHRIIRVMTKVCAAREIGLEAFALVALIGHQWDAIRYRRPVAYHLADLMNLCGIKHKTAFYRIEKRALASGWLMKLIKGRRQPSVYWIAIPPAHAGVEDTATVDEEDDTSLDVSQSVSPTVSQSVSQSVSPFIPLPSPNPSPGESGSDVFEDSKTPAKPVAPSDRWIYEQREAWCATLRAANVKIRSDNWEVWKAICARAGDGDPTAGVMRVAKAALTMPAKQRWPDAVEDAVADLPADDVAEVSTPRPVVPLFDQASAIVTAIGWKRAADLIGLTVDSEARLLIWLDSDPERFAKPLIERSAKAGAA